MADKDQLSDKLRDKEKAEEDRYFAACHHFVVLPGCR